MQKQGALMLSLSTSRQNLTHTRQQWERGGGRYHLTSFQQPSELRLKLKSPNCIAVLLAADAGFDDFFQQG